VDAGIVGINEQYDVALLQILRPATYKSAGVCFANTLAPGEAVTGFGFPDGLERQSSPGTFGNASADNGRWAVSFNNAEGMSGGPLYDQFGDVVGIIRGTYGGQGASNVITPVRRAKGLIDEQTSFDEECLRSTPVPAPASTDDWYGGSLWKDGDDYCDDIGQLVAAPTHLGALHYADTGKTVAKLVTAPIKENLVFTLAAANDPQCAIETEITGLSSDTSVVDCMIDISKTPDTFQAVYTSAAKDLGQCLKRMGWTLAEVNADCSNGPDGVICHHIWQKGGHDTQLYGFSSGDPAVFGLGLYASIPAGK
jgi:hypothetical protein